MGYETRLYVVEKTSVPGVLEAEEGKVWGDVIAMFDLRKCYPLSDRLRNCPPTNCYIFSDDGNTEIVEDCYGEPLKETTVEHVLQILNNIMEEEGYRRLFPLAAYLNAIQAQKQDGEWGDLAVLHYGY